MAKNRSRLSAFIGREAGVSAVLAVASLGFVVLAWVVLAVMARG
ncbi:hypothetical protein [Moraxella lacunata]